MYTPSFLEIFVGWVAVVAWASWLRGRTTETAAGWVLSALPWVTGVAVLLGQVGAVLGIMQQSGSSANPHATDLVRDASFGSAGVIVLALAMEAVLTGVVLLRRKQG